MCIWGDDVEVLVPIDVNLSHDGVYKWEYRKIDRCLVPLIEYFNSIGLYTSNCCCGHGKECGIIYFIDGQILKIPNKQS